MTTETTILAQDNGTNWTAINGDCVEAMRDIPDNSVGFSVFSPPFVSLYIYSDSERDMGNVGSDAEFHECYYHVARELFRVTKPGRLCAIHVKDIWTNSHESEDGSRGLRDFSGDCIRTHERAGWNYHTRITIWRCPVHEMQKTKAEGLLYKNIRLNSAVTRVGRPEYLIVFRKWAEGMKDTDRVTHDPEKFPVDLWQQWASPVWMDTDSTNVLNERAGRDPDAERHLCPMPLDLSSRAIQLWSNPGDVVLTPFMGIGSEVVSAIRTGRKAIGIELNPNYYAQAVRYARDAEANAKTLFDDV